MSTQTNTTTPKRGMTQTEFAAQLRRITPNPVKQETRLRVKAAVDLIYRALVVESRDQSEETRFTLRVRGSRDVVNTTIALKLQALQAGDVSLIQDELPRRVRDRVQSTTAQVDVSRIHISPRNDVLLVVVDIYSGLRTLFKQDAENFEPR